MLYSKSDSHWTAFGRAGFFWKGGISRFVRQIKAKGKRIEYVSLHNRHVYHVSIYIP